MATPHADTEVLHFRLPTVVINELRRVAKENDRPLTREVVRALKFWVAQNDARQGADPTDADAAALLHAYARQAP